MRRSDPDSKELGGPVIVAGTAAAYFALAFTMWNLNPTWGSAFWPAAGITFAVLVRARWAWWPAVIAAVAATELLADLHFHLGVKLALLGALANVVEPAAGAALFRRCVPSRRLSDLGALGWFVLAGVVVGPAAGAFVGGVFAPGGTPAALDRWLRWAVGDGVGVLAVAPLLLTVWRPGAKFLQRRGLELLAGVVALGAVCAAMVSPFGSVASVAPYVAVLVGLWAALRFGVGGAAASSTVIACVVHAATATGHGPFVTGGSADLVVAQVFVGVLAVSTLTVAVLIEDLTDRREVERALVQRALRDPLTGAGNRAMLADRLAHEEPGGILAIDLNNFKAINDTFGHAVGDLVLCEVVRRLMHECRPDDLVVRLGGDEFVVVVAGPVDDIGAIAGRIDLALSKPMSVDGTMIPISASVGGVAAADDIDPEQLMRQADLAMYRRKASWPE